MHQLGDVEELLLAGDHLPVRVEADVPHQGDHRVEDLGDAATEKAVALMCSTFLPFSGSESSRICSIKPLPQMWV